MVQTASDYRACLGHCSLRVQGVRIRPTQYTPASVFSGNGTATSPARMPNSSSAMWFSVSGGGLWRAGSIPQCVVGISCIKISLCLSIVGLGLYPGPTDWEESHYECADRLR